MKKILFTLLLFFAGAAVIMAQNTPSGTKAKAKPKTETVTYVVDMHCQNCVDKLTDQLSFLKGVKDCKISLSKKTVTLKFNPSQTEEKTFVEAIEKLGYTATKKEDTPPEKKAVK